LRRDGGEYVAWTSWSVLAPGPLARTRKSMLQPSPQERNFMSSTRLIAAAVLLGFGAALIGSSVLSAQEKKDAKADDEKTQLNKALTLAASIGKLDQVKELLKKGADPQWRDPMGNGKTAMVRAVMSGKLETVKFLVESGVDPHAPDGSGRYPVYFLCI